MEQSKIQSVFQEIDNMRITYDEGSEIISKLSDEFAIGFAEWCLKNEMFAQFKITLNETNELLEIYKKEIGL
jgi:hypothetical protein